MPTYQYECSNVRCNHKFEEVQSMLDAKFTKCPICKRQTLYRLIGRGDNVIIPTTGLYDFVDEKTTRGKVRINSKRQWKEHLKRVGQIEAPNTLPTRSQIESEQRTKRMVAKRELKETIVKAVKDKRYINETKQKILSKRGGL